VGDTQGKRQVREDVKGGVGRFERRSNKYNLVMSSKSLAGSYLNRPGRYLGQVGEPIQIQTEEADFNEHLNEFNKITTEFTSLEVEIEEEDKALLLLPSLPSSFDNIVTTLLFIKETLRLDEVVAALLIEKTQ